MMTYLVTVCLLFALMAAGIAVQRLYRRFAARHPELGPFRPEEAGCGNCSAGNGCSTSACGRRS